MPIDSASTSKFVAMLGFILSFVFLLAIVALAFT
jgi:hypothetical protein